MYKGRAVAMHTNKMAADAPEQLRVMASGAPSIQGSSMLNLQNI
jgi:hypothetical protein